MVGGRLPQAAAAGVAAAAAAAMGRARGETKIHLLHDKYFPHHIKKHHHL